MNTGKTQKRLSWKPLLNVPLRELIKLVRHPGTVYPYLQKCTRYDFLERLSGCDPAKIKSIELELLGNFGFYRAMDEKLVPVRGIRTGSSISNGVFYILVRLRRPSVVVETGVFDGKGSCFTLQALHDNQHGHLISIDLPARKLMVDSTRGMGSDGTLPPGCDPGWLIPGYLRDRHRLIFGDSRQILKGLLAEYPAVDVFFHDSLHTREHMLFEYRTVWEHLADGGILLSDDVFAAGSKGAFFKFAREVVRPYHLWANLGAIVK